MFNVSKKVELSASSQALVIGLFEGNKLDGIQKEVDDALEGQLTLLLEEGDVSGSFKKVSKLYSMGKTGVKRFYFIGLGKQENFTYRKALSAFGKAVKSLNGDKLDEASFALDTFSSHHLHGQSLAQSLGEAVIMAGYRFEDYKKRKEALHKGLSSVTVYTEEDETDCKAALKTGEAYGHGTNRARTLVNMPGNKLTPTNLAQQAADIAKEYDMDIEILEKEDMERLGMGALLAVNQGSDQPPKMIVMKYQGREKWDNVLSFVGKGLTFDAGGISLKPAKGMEAMKSDMGGSAAVLGAMEAIARTKPKVNVLAVIPSTENLINGSAMKPGDVITSLSGKTIEVNNTDAEGRLILADGITYAKQLGADYLVDLATLTGAVLVALGQTTTGAVSNNDEFYAKLETASEKSGEYVWRFPHHQEYKDMVRTSDVADLNNAPGRNAGSITAGLFLGEFAGDTPWIHLDIAGTAFLQKETEVGPKGGTGVMVRTLANLASNFKA
ncbi:leucyl aminopeptidase [Pseudalkalibacillus caeni]|uniref:Probable cytosol aminopeptidase n=1 Tax=Exobacillus caeni TaxID=2574798 RepID=A0A5R9FE68_9BACL|nr:leucyl aminopeptidase [Pseudalkalibacillus caeni]TLS38864.1 leucyl aminopeptidase [Pseudalkalibacillus caeni]